MRAVLAAAPIAVVLIVMVGLRRPALEAALAGAALTLLLALTAFGSEAAGDAPLLVVGSLTEALHVTATILWIIFPALALYELQTRSGATERIRSALAGLSDDRRILTLLIAWFFGLFMEGAAGFGTPVALAAPLLLGLGFGPVRAVSLALIGHAAGVSFGAVGTPVLAQAEITGVAASSIAFPTGLLHALFGSILIVFLTRMADERPLSGSDLKWMAAAAACFLLPFFSLAALVGPELPTIGGALVGGAAFVALLRRGSGARIGATRTLAADLAPYAAIFVLVLATRLLPAAQETLRALELSWEIGDRFDGAFQPLYHPGSMLLLGLIVAGFLPHRAAHFRASAAAAAARLVPVSLALFAVLAMARLMVHSGMIIALAEGAAQTGAAWPLIAPFIGALGTFVTGSATASNILFSDFQVTTAEALSLAPVLMLAAQGFGAAVGNIICPHNIIAGGATVGLKGQEGDVLARTSVACLVYAIAGGCAVLVLSLIR